jgi:transposase
MEEFSTYVGLDVHAASISICALAAGVDGEELFAGTIPATPEALSRLIGKVKKRGKALFCYEAGCCGYGIYRQIVASGEACRVIAPSLIPRKPGERVKTDRRDARKSAQLLRVGQLTAIWVPDEAHEAMRDLLRLRHQAVRARVAAQLRLTSFLLRQRRRPPCRRWTRAYRIWLSQQSFERPAHRFVFKHLVDHIAEAEAAAKRVEKEVLALVPAWRLAPMVEALRSLRGIDVIGAASLAAAIGDVRRFADAPALMGYFGLVPSEHTSGAKRRQGAITKTGESEARRILVEAAWCHRSPPRPSPKKQAILANQPPKIRDIAKRCETRLHRRTRALIGRGKRATVTATAIAREQAGFVWAIAREVALPA